MPSKFKIARVLLGKSQLQVAAESGIHTSIVSQLENGWRIPTPSQVERLRRVLPNLDQVEKLSR